MYLTLKAICQMFEYFDRKASTPLVVCLNRTNRHNVTRAVTDLLRKDYVVSDELLKQILSEVREAISTVISTNILDKNTIASMRDLDRMVKDEFRFALNGSFSEEKVNKIGPTFVNAVSRFTSTCSGYANFFSHTLPSRFHSKSDGSKCFEQTRPFIVVGRSNRSNQMFR